MSSQVQQLEDGKSKAAESFSDSPTLDYFRQLADARRALLLPLTSATHLELGSSAGRLFEFGDKNSKLLANLVADSKMQTVVSEMCCSDGRVFSEPEQMLHEFRSFSKIFIKRPLIGLVSSLKHTCNPHPLALIS